LRSAPKPKNKNKILIPTLPPLFLPGALRARRSKRAAPEVNWTSLIGNSFPMQHPRWQSVKQSCPLMQIPNGGQSHINWGRKRGEKGEISGALWGRFVNIQIHARQAEKPAWNGLISNIQDSPRAQNCF